MAAQRATGGSGAWPWPGWAELCGAALLGAAHSLPFVATSAWWLQPICIALLVWRVKTAAPPRAALLGWAFGTAWLLCGMWWLYISLHRYGGLPAWMAALAVGLLCAGLALLLAVACATFARFRCGRTARDTLLFASLWTLTELIRGSIFTGLPWVASGYAHVDSPLAALAPWIGVYGIGGVAAALAAAPALAGGGLTVLGKPLLAGISVLAALALAPVPEFTRATSTLSVALLQGNVPQNEKFSLEHLPQAMQWTRAQLLGADADLVVGPETVIPLLPHQLDARYWEPLLEHFREAGRAALVGLPLGNERQGYTNSAAGIAASTAALPDGFYRYDKVHLVPFGEFIPPLFKWFVRLMDIPLGDFKRGTLAAPSFAVKGERIGPNICYEDLFGEELATRFTDPALAPTILANLSNIGWFGQTIAVEQHLNISRMRSLELQRAMLRATNTGATAVIDHRGQVTHALAPHTQGVLHARVEGRSGVTPFARWAGAAGLWPIGAIALLLCLALARWRKPD
ncbi:MAG: apolipoprotein N-acyltransferase [Burkholderiaceae bacterium]